MCVGGGVALEGAPRGGGGGGLDGAPEAMLLSNYASFPTSSTLSLDPAVTDRHPASSGLHISTQQPFNPTQGPINFKAAFSP